MRIEITENLIGNIMLAVVRTLEKDFNTDDFVSNYGQHLLMNAIKKGIAVEQNKQNVKEKVK